MRKFLILMILSYSFFSHSQINIKVNSRDVVVDEPFNILVSVNTNSSEEPIVSFNPVGLEVLGRENHGVSTRTIYMNGRITVSREVTFSYEVVAHRLGIAQIKDIKAEFSGQTLNHPSVTFNVRKEPIQKADIFIDASVDKESAFVGEGVQVVYYLYRKFEASGFEIKKFPKLNGFFKRFIQEQERAERVEYDGEIYLRNPIYATYIFPEKAGALTIDSLDLKVSYPDMASNNLGFGFGIRGMKTKTLTSKPVQLNVLPTPVEGLKVGFTGLVGNHSFKLEQNKMKFLANEPIELTLTIEGDGALEKLETPTIIQDKLLEEFEASSEFINIDSKTAKKIIKYTFLGRGSLNLPAKKINLSYFSAKEKRYIDVSLDFNGIEVTGTSAPESQTVKDDTTAEKNDVLDNIFKEDKNINFDPSGVLGFDFGISTMPILKYIFWFVFLTLIILSIGITAYSRGFLFLTQNNKYDSNLRKGKFNYENVFKFLASIDSGHGVKNGLEKAKLSDGSKKYFMTLIEVLEQKQFANQKKDAKLPRFEKKYFDEFNELLKDEKHK